MKIAVFNWKDIRNPDAGGAEILLYELGKRLVADGHEVTWFCRKYKGCKEKENIKGIGIVRKGNRFSVYSEAWRYCRNVKKKPDKVIESVNTICWQTPLYISKEKRIVLQNQLAREVFFYELPFPLSYAAYLLERVEYLTYRSSKFLCYSESVKKDLVQFGIPAENISVFPLGLDHNRYFPGEKSKNPLFVFVARLSRMKRADLCIKAMKLVCNKHPKSQFAIIGYGPEEENLMKMINEYNLQKNVYIVNKDNLFFEKNEKDIKVKLMRQAWCLLLPSVKEGWGMVVTEAAACGTPAIVSDVTGLKDSVVDKKTGFIISKNPTIEELSNSMMKIIENKNLRQNLFKNAYNWAKNFSWETSYQRFCRLVF